MQSNLETFGVIHHHCCTQSNLLGPNTEDCWKSPLKIMLVLFSFNVTSCSGINNLWKHRSTRRNWKCLSIAVTLCLLVSMTDARPAAAGSKSLRDHSRYFFVQSSTSNYMAQNSVNTDTSSSSDTLSIFSPLDVLRQNMLLEIQRRRIRHAQHRQVKSNKEYLDRIGR
ncbi:Diuretic hormone [Orchesella cincta]|uniref:Diuretic hormone n=1 Tax=Orchesella cincta TaxID=48709 RepID=A0A1D2MSG0_ORCCI|nr:Diuretic hormone [Orchesella cincta]